VRDLLVRLKQGFSGFTSVVDLFAIITIVRRLPFGWHEVLQRNWLNGQRGLSGIYAFAVRHARPCRILNSWARLKSRRLRFTLGYRDVEHRLR
jgi:hypothetical protein